MTHCIVWQAQQVLIREQTINPLLIPYLWATTICIVSRVRSNTSHRQVCSLTARSMQAMNSLILTARMRAESSNSTMFVILTTARKKLLRRVRISTTDTSTPMMLTETLSISTPLVSRKTARRMKRRPNRNISGTRRTACWQPMRTVL